jgi:hypothetical protein
MRIPAPLAGPLRQSGRTGRGPAAPPLRMLVWLAPFAWLPLGGCGILGGTDVGQRTAGGSTGRTISVDELDQITKNFADRFVLFLGKACDDIKRAATSSEERQNAHRLKLAGATAAYDIATGSDPVKQLVDMAILVELHHIVWVDEGQSVRLFGDNQGERLSQALTAAQTEIWELATRVMTPEQIQTLEETVQEWRQVHPRLDWISELRFDTVAGSDGLTLIGGALGQLSPASGNVTDSIGQSRLLGQRAFYYAKRLPMLLDWQVESALDDALAVPAVSQLIKEVSGTLDASAGLLARLDSLMRSSETQSEELDARLTQIQRTVAEGKDLARAVRQAAEACEGLVESTRKFTEQSALFAPGQGAKKFEIAEYTAAAEQFGKTFREASDLLHETRAVTESQLALQRLAELIDTAARDLAKEGRDATDHAAWRAAELVILFVVLLSLGKASLLWLGKGRSRASEQEPTRR